VKVHPVRCPEAVRTSYSKSRQTWLPDEAILLGKCASDRARDRFPEGNAVHAFRAKFGSGVGKKALFPERLHVGGSDYDFSGPAGHCRLEPRGELRERYSGLHRQGQATAPNARPQRMHHVGGVTRR
jgi:hypothetical protein